MGSIPEPPALRPRFSSGIGKRKLPLTTVIRLTCPACGHVFEQVAVELTVFDAGREEFPKSVVVEESALKR